MNSPETDTEAAVDTPEVTLSQQIHEAEHTANALEHQAIEERSLLFASIVSELSRRQKGLTDSESPSHRKLTETAAMLAEQLGISKIVRIYNDPQVYNEATQQELKQLCDDLRQARKRSGLTQQGLANQLGVSRYTIMRAEQGDIGHKNQHIPQYMDFIYSTDPGHFKQYDPDSRFTSTLFI